MTGNDPAEAAKRAEAQKAEMEALIGYLLLAGVALSVVLIVFGLVWHWLRAGRLDFDYVIPKLNLFEFVSLEIHEVAAGHFRPRLSLNLGIAALLLTPYLRVLASLLFFAIAEHNWKYSTFTALVLIVLTYSLFLR
jgi:uncharacterized membrane protein